MENTKIELKNLLNEFPFLKNIHFTNWAKVSNSTVYMFASGNRYTMPDIELFYELCTRVLRCKYFANVDGYMKPVKYVKKATKPSKKKKPVTKTKKPEPWP